MSQPCGFDSTLLERFLDDELHQKEYRMVKSHLDQCKPCSHALATLKMSADLLTEHLNQAVDRADFSAFEDRVMTEIQTQKPPSWHAKVSLWFTESLQHNRTAWVASTITALVLLFALLPFVHQTKSPVDNEVIIDSMEYAGERSMVFSVSKNNTTVIWMVDFDGPGSLDSPEDQI